MAPIRPTDVPLDSSKHLASIGVGVIQIRPILILVLGVQRNDFYGVGTPQKSNFDFFHLGAPTSRRLKGGGILG